MECAPLGVAGAPTYAIGRVVAAMNCSGGVRAEGLTTTTAHGREARGRTALVERGAYGMANEDHDVESVTWVLKTIKSCPNGAEHRSRRKLLETRNSECVFSGV